MELYKIDVPYSQVNILFILHLKQYTFELKFGYNQKRIHQKRTFMTIKTLLNFR